MTLMPSISRRQFLTTTAATTAAAATGLPVSAAPKPDKAQIALTLDLEMSRHYPRRGLTEWDYQKGNLDKATKAYSLKAARVAHDMGAKIHFFCVGRVLEQPDVGWLKEIIQMGHPVGNHTYDHVNVLATNPKQTQFRFQRAPWLLRGRTAAQVIEQNIATTNVAMPPGRNRNWAAAVATGSPIAHSRTPNTMVPAPISIVTALPAMTNP